MTRRHLPGLFLVLGLALAGFWSARNFRLENSVVVLLPPASQELALLARRVIDSSAARSMVLSVGPRNGAELGTDAQKRAADAARKVARRLADALERDPGVAWVRTGPPTDIEAATYRLYFPRRFNFIDDHPGRLSDKLDGRGIDASVARLKRELAGPAGSWLSAIAPRDPLLLFDHQLQRIQGFQNTSLSLTDGQFTAKDGHAILFVGLRQSAFDSSAQRPLLGRIAAEFQKSAGGLDLVLEQSGFNVFSVDTEDRIQRDTSRVAVLSILGLLALFLVLFRTLSSIVVLFLPLAAAFVGALAACLAVFGEIHGLTLAFGASLLGVCIDYPIHLINHRGLSTHGRELPASITRGLLLGAGTTIVGMGALAWTDFEVLRQVAVFSASGLTTALLFTLLVLPLLPTSGRSELRLWLAMRLPRWLRAAERHQRLVVVCSALVLGGGAAGIAHARWAGSLEALAPLDPALRLEDARVRSRIGAPGSNDLVIAVGRTDAEALARNDIAHAHLERARAEGSVRAFQSIHPFVWNPGLQAQNFEQAAAGRVKNFVQASLVEQGFDETMFTPFFDEHRSLEFDPLTLTALERSPLAAVVERFVVRADNKTVILSYPEFRGDRARFVARIAPEPGIDFIDQRSLLDGAYSRLRGQVQLLLTAGAVVMSLAVWLRFRTLGRTAASLLPGLTAPPAALGILAWLGYELNLFHLIAALVVLSMAMDYGIFLSETVEARTLDAPATGATLLSLILAAVTTCLSFGLLAFSEIPVLLAIGQTIALGILIALAAIPVAWLLHARLPPAA